jgi:hypothetical protein
MSAGDVDGAAKAIDNPVSDDVKASMSAWQSAQITSPPARRRRPA